MHIRLILEYLEKEKKKNTIVLFRNMSCFVIWSIVCFHKFSMQARQNKRISYHFVVQCFLGTYKLYPQHIESKKLIEQGKLCQIFKKKKKYWNEQPFPSPRALPNPGIESGSPTLQADSLPSQPPENTAHGINLVLLIHELSDLGILESHVSSDLKKAHFISLIHLLRKLIFRLLFLWVIQLSYLLIILITPHFRYDVGIV